MFGSAILRLTGAYLGILMAISFAFSVAVYQVSVAALDESLHLQVRAIQEQPRFRVLARPFNLDQLIEEQLIEGRQRIMVNLFGANIIVLVAGGAASYWFAGRTLRPIERALEAQTRFTADASHELRTPLASMRAEIEVALRDKKLSIKEARELLQSNLEETDRLHHLAQGLLTLSKYQTGEQVPMSDVSLKVVAEEARERLGGKIAKAKIMIQGEATITGDRESLISLFVILLDNAIKYSDPPAEVTVDIKKQGRKAHMTVTDNGKGINAADIPHIFDRFYRGDSSRSKLTKGYGLGLSIAQQVVEMHQGAISVKSQIGKGTTMSISLPTSPAKKNLPL